jgi:hypothetical protein
MIQVPELDGWKILVQNQFFDELIRAPDDVLNFHETTFDVGDLWSNTDAT